MDAALVAMIAKDRRSELTTRIAVDTGRVDKEVARDILR